MHNTNTSADTTLKVHAFLQVDFTEVGMSTQLATRSKLHMLCKLTLATTKPSKQIHI